MSTIPPNNKNNENNKNSKKQSPYNKIINNFIEDNSTKIKRIKESTSAVKSIIFNARNLEQKINVEISNSKHSNENPSKHTNNPSKLTTNLSNPSKHTNNPSNPSKHTNNSSNSSSFPSNPSSFPSVRDFNNYKSKFTNKNTSNISKFGSVNNYKSKFDKNLSNLPPFASTVVTNNKNKKIKFKINKDMTITIIVSKNTPSNSSGNYSNYSNSLTTNSTYSNYSNSSTTPSNYSNSSGNSPGNCNAVISKYLATEKGAVYSIKNQSWSINATSYNSLVLHLKKNLIQFDKIPSGILKSVYLSSFNNQKDDSGKRNVINNNNNNNNIKILLKNSSGRNTSIANTSIGRNTPIANTSVGRNTPFNSLFNNSPRFNLKHPIYDKLMPFQYKGVLFGLEKGGRVLLADDMGLGKTIQALAIAQYYSLEFPLLIIAPASLLDNWRESIKLFLGEESTIIRTKLDFGDKISIISYSLASKFSSIINNNINENTITNNTITNNTITNNTITNNTLANNNITNNTITNNTITNIPSNSLGVIICDECHYIKNCKSKRSQSLIPILQKVSRLIMISGTPALSRPCELYGIISAINKNLFSNFKEYGMRYCGGVLVKNSFYDFKGCTNADELNTILESEMMIRRLKCDVLRQLPAKTRRQVILTYTPEKIKVTEDTPTRDVIKDTPRETPTRDVIKDTPIRDVIKDVINVSSGVVDDSIMARYNQAAILKQKPVLEYLEPMLEKDLKFIIFAHHIEMIDCINNFLIKKNVNFIKIIGSTPSAKRHHLVEKFQNQPYSNPKDIHNSKDKEAKDKEAKDKEVKVALLSLTACSTGITLTAAKAVVFAELYWNPGTMVQAEDRIHRIGQLSCVDIHYLVCKNTIDEIVWPILIKKLKTLEQLGIGKNELSSMEKKVINNNNNEEEEEYLEEENKRFRELEKLEKFGFKKK